MVRLEDQNGEYADKYELDVVPCLVLFHEKRPRVFKGQISDEKEAIKWFREIVASFEDWKKYSVSKSCENKCALTT